MSSIRRQLIVASVCWLALAACSVQADVVSVPADFTAIQAAIDVAPENAGRVISIGQGTVNMGTSFFRLNKWGVSLRGAGPGLTVFETSQTTQNAAGSCYANSEGTPLLTVCKSVNPAPPPPAGTQPTVIEGITFRNSAPRPFSSPYNGAEKGIGVLMSGPSAENPSIVRNCEFINLWKNGPTGIGIELVDASGTRPNNWHIENCRFDGSKSGVYVNGNSNITIANSTFTRFRAGVINDANDKSYDLTIARNDFIGGWTTLTRPSLADVVVAISLSSNADANGDARNWFIINNNISNVQRGIEVTYSSPGPSSLAAVDISTNSIRASFCSILFPCLNVINRSPQDVDVTVNWWGDAAGPDPNRFQATSTGQILFDPWIESFSGEDPGCNTGFCPLDVVLSNAVVSLIQSVTARPSLVAAGSTVTVTVVLVAPADGTLTWISSPDGIVCPEVTLQQQNPVEVTCTVDAGAAAGNYSITAVVTTAVGADAQSADVEVCQNLPWPFTADVQACQPCSFDCVTGVFTCSNCSCSCPNDAGHEGPYDGGHYEQQPYENRPGYEHGSDSYGYGGEDRAGYGYGPGSSLLYHHNGDEDRLFPSLPPGSKTPYGHDKPDVRRPYDDTPYHQDGPHADGPYGDKKPYNYRRAPGDDEYVDRRDRPDVIRDHHARRPVFPYKPARPPARNCQRYGGELCVCNPEPLTAAANCEVVSYDTCMNRLVCTPRA